MCRKTRVTKYFLISLAEEIALVLRVTLDFFGFALPRSVIGLENSRYHLN